MKPVSSARGKHSQARIVCIAEGCLTVWDDERAGALAAFIDKDGGEALWHREFAAAGARPALAVSAWGAVVAWYENSRIKLASITRDGLGPASLLTKVSGFQPYPEVVPGTEAGQWYISWRDYEAGQLESFVLRTQCR
jgi:hypothetical protein